MNSIKDYFNNLFSTKKTLPMGIFQYQAPPDAEYPYRLHLRIESGGSGLLIVNAATILHLNQSATEYAYHMIQQTPVDEAIKQITSRYDVPANQATEDYENFKDQITSLLDLPDVDPISSLGFERETPYSGDLSAPYRMDCAVTYQLPEFSDPHNAPTSRVDRELSTEDWKSILEASWRAGIPHVVFTGGEPTLREDLVEIILHAESLGQVTGLLTNGTKLADRNYMERILNSGLDHLLITSTPSLDEMWTALENVLPEDLHTTLHFTLDQDNYGDFSTALKRAAKLDINAISLSIVDPALEDLLLEARNLVAELDLPLVWDLPVPYSASNPIAMEAESQISGVGRAWIYIEPDGDVLPAQGINKVAGNMLTDPWGDIWEALSKPAG